MMGFNNGRAKRPVLPALVIAFVLVASGTALAVSGASTLVSPGDDSAATDRAAQQPLGDRSATPRAPNSGAGGLEDQAESNQTPGGGQGSAPDSNTVVPASGGGGGDRGSLPFTGLLAIPVLIAGMALLLAGLVTRRRVSGPSAA